MRIDSSVRCLLIRFGRRTARTFTVSDLTRATQTLRGVALSQYNHLIIRTPNIAGNCCMDLARGDIVDDGRELALVSRDECALAARGRSLSV